MATIKIQGIIKDSQTKEVLVFASLGLNRYPIGTSTNRNGEFQLLVGDSLANETLTVSIIGYESKEFRISEMNTNYFEIFLDPKTILLEEVQVLAPITAEEVLRKVIENHNRNYPFGFSYYETFFRDLVIDDSPQAKIQNCRLTEAAINIEDFGLDAFRDSKFKAHEIRNSYSHVETNKFSKLMIIGIIGGLKNPISWVYSYKDMISRYNLKKLLKDECYSKEILDLTVYEGTPVYRLEIRQRYGKVMGRKYECTKAYKSIILYINTKDWAIQEARETLMSSWISLNGEFLPWKQVELKMQEFNGKYYLKLIDFDGYIPDEYYKFGKDVDYRHKTSILVNDIVLDRKSIERIRLRNAMKADLPLWNVEYKYNPEFWRTYNILLDKPIDPSEKKDLEQEIPLDNQFNDGGLKNSKKIVN
ncbi:MAG: carboxypeptidase-like regulatory domain-containing protein [Mariniphaga sp.]|nr:carboxypeptidase-like regulatory domain-containing protein [Mariniphaga sp.]